MKTVKMKVGDMNFTYNSLSDFNFDISEPHNTADYIIFKDDDGMVYAKNGKTGRIDFQGSDAASVIQNTLSKMKDGGILHIKSGTYYITQTITLENTYDNIIIRGDNENRNNLNGGTRLIVSTDIGKLFYLHGTFTPFNYVQNIQFENMTIDGNGNTFDAIYGEYLTHLKIYNVWFTNITGHAIYINKADVSLIYNNSFEKCGDNTNSKAAVYVSTPSSIGTNNIIIKNNDFSFNNYADLEFSTGSFFNIVISANYFENNNTGNYSILTPPARSTIYGNTFLGTIGNSWVYIDTIDSFRIINNFFSGTVPNAHIYVSNSYYGIIANNVFKDSGYAIYAYGLNRSIINSNTIANTDYGISVTGFSENTIISNNMIAGSTNDAIIIGSGHVSILENTIRSTTTGINLTSASASCIVKDNKFVSVTTPISDNGNSNIIKYNPGYSTENSSTATFSGDGTTTQFTIAHGLVSTPNKVLVTPMSADAAGTFYVTADATNIYVNYTTAPTAGTDNVVLSWYAEV